MNLYWVTACAHLELRPPVALFPDKFVGFGWLTQKNDEFQHFQVRNGCSSLMFLMILHVVGDEDGSCCLSATTGNT